LIYDELEDNDWVEANVLKDVNPDGSITCRGRTELVVATKAFFEGYCDATRGSQALQVLRILQCVWKVSKAAHKQVTTSFQVGSHSLL
jgi:hypothetical protein